MKRLLGERSVGVIVTGGINKTKGHDSSILKSLGRKGPSGFYWQSKSKLVDNVCDKSKEILD